MHERIQFIDHQGKRVLLVDFSNCPASEVEKIARAVPDYLTVNPRDSVLVLTDFTGAVFDRDAVRAVKETAVFDRPFVNVNDLESMVMWTGISDLDLWLVQNTLPPALDTTNWPPKQAPARISSVPTACFCPSGPIPTHFMLLNSELEDLEVTNMPRLSNSGPETRLALAQHCAMKRWNFSRRTPACRKISNFCLAGTLRLETVAHRPRW